VSTLDCLPGYWNTDAVQSYIPTRACRNRKAPMPELVISGSSTASVVPPPPAAFQPTLRILKRPTASSSNSAASAAPQDTQKSYAEREAQYQAARERIFSKEGARTPAGRRDSAEDDGAQASTRAMNGRALASPSPADTIGVKVIRGPRGPSALPGDDSQASSADVLPPRGFVGRRGKGNPRS